MLDESPYRKLWERSVPAKWRFRWELLSRKLESDLYTFLPRLFLSCRIIIWSSLLDRLPTRHYSLEVQGSTCGRRHFGESGTMRLNRWACRTFISMTCDTSQPRWRDKLERPKVNSWREADGALQRWSCATSTQRPSGIRPSRTRSTGSQCHQNPNPTKPIRAHSRPS